MDDEAFVQELRGHWIRFNEAEALATRDGYELPVDGKPGIASVAW